MASSLQSLFIKEDSYHPVGPFRSCPSGQACSHLLALLLFVLIFVGIADASIVQPVIKHQPLLWEVHGQL